MIIAGLTGGIATGKSTVSEMFAKAGANIIDADSIAKEAVKQGAPAWKSIVREFGREILLPGGEIDRDALGRIIFNDPGQKAKLNQIVHPRVFQVIAEKLKKIQDNTPDALAILDVPLLVETDMHKDMQVVILVYVPEDIQLRRLMARDEISEKEALAKIRSQMPIEEKKKLADFVIDNKGSLEDTWQKAMEVYSRLEQSKNTKTKNGMK